MTNVNIIKHAITPTKISVIYNISSYLFYK